FVSSLSNTNTEVVTITCHCCNDCSFFCLFTDTVNNCFTSSHCNVQEELVGISQELDGFFSFFQRNIFHSCNERSHLFQEVQAGSVVTLVEFVSHTNGFSHNNV